VFTVPKVRALLVTGDLEKHDFILFWWFAIKQRGRSAAVFASVHAIEEYVPGNL
jgi:hypothetical protein